MELKGSDFNSQPLQPSALTPIDLPNSSNYLRPDTSAEPHLAVPLLAPQCNFINNLHRAEL